MAKNPTKEEVQAMSNEEFMSRFPPINWVLVFNPENEKQLIAVNPSNAVAGFTYEDYLKHEDIPKRFYSFS